MKKLAKFLLVLSIAMVLVVTPAFAADSMSEAAGITEAKDADGNAVAVTTEASSVAFTTAIAAEKINGVEANELTVVYQQDVHAEKFPVTLTFSIAGATGTMYVYHYNGSSWDLVATGTAPTMTVTFDSLSPIAIVTKGTTTSGSTSDKTGETAGLAIACAIAVAAGTAAVVIRRKKVNA